MKFILVLVMFGAMMDAGGLKSCFFGEIQDDAEVNSDEMQKFIKRLNSEPRGVAWDMDNVWNMNNVLTKTQVLTKQGESITQNNISSTRPTINQLSNEKVRLEEARKVVESLSNVIFTNLSQFNDEFITNCRSTGRNNEVCKNSFAKYMTIRTKIEKNLRDLGTIYSNYIAKTPELTWGKAPDSSIVYLFKNTPSNMNAENGKINTRTGKDRGASSASVAIRKFQAVTPRIKKLVQILISNFDRSISSIDAEIAKTKLEKK